MSNKEVVKAWYSALEANDFNAIKNLMEDNYQFRNPISPDPVNAEEHLKMMNAMKGAFEARHEFDLFVEQDDYIVVRGKWKAKHIGDFNGIPATGKLVELYLIDIFHIINGKVTGHHTEFNPMRIIAEISDPSALS
jgi:steroid delta-isomerase-like uncharacterized protein